MTEYLGAPIAGVSSYKVRVGMFTSTTIFGWEEAKQLAEEYMADLPYEDIEILAVTYVKAPKYIEQANRSVRLFREQLACYANRAK